MMKRLRLQPDSVKPMGIQKSGMTDLFVQQKGR